jgi:hypothetical protein
MAHVRDIEYYTFEESLLITGVELFRYVTEYYRKHFNKRAFIGGYTCELKREDGNWIHYAYKVEVILV